MRRKFSCLSIAGVCSVFVSSAVGQLQVGTPDKPLPKTIWQIADGGTALNPQSRLECPAEAGEFHRISVQTYNPFGVDVSCGYQNASHDVITFYIALRGNQQTVDQEYTAAKAAIVQREPNAAPLAEADQQTFMSDLDWRHTIYRLNGATQTGVWMTRFGGWNVEFRATYASSRTEPVFAALSALSATGQKTAGTHIAACFSMGPVMRDGRAILNEKMFPALSVSGTLTAQAVSQSAQSSSANAPNWCVQQPLTINGAQYLLWRNAADQNGGAADRITALAENAAVIFSVADGAWQNTITSGDKPNAPPYDIVIETPDAIQLVGVYEGRPAVQELAKFTANRGFALYASFDKKTSKATIFRPPLPNQATPPAP